MFPLLENVSLSDEGFQHLVSHLKKVSGIKLSHSKKIMVETRLQKRLREMNCESFEVYLDLLLIPGSKETRYFIDSLTTNETYFYREPVHFEFLEKLFRTEFARVPNIRCWSAASSYGHEAFSIAMLANQVFPMGGWKITATDISEAALERAKIAEFDPYDYRMLPQVLQEKYTSTINTCIDGYRRVNANICRSIDFKQANLLSAIPFSNSFEIIFLRNVLIYFEMDNKLKIIKNVLKHLKPGGYLFISISEAPLSREICQHTSLVNQGKGIFKLPD